MKPLEPYNSYKSENLSWIQTVPSHWDVRRAKFLFNLEKRPPRDSDGIVTAFRDGEVTLRSNRRTDGFTNSFKEIGYQGVRKGDLVIHAMDAFAGAIGVSDSDGKSTPVYSCLTARDGAYIPYYAALLRSMALSGFIQSLAKGIRERSTDFRWGEISELSLPVPPMPEQDLIAKYLDRETARVDTLIAKKTRFIELLKEKRQAIITKAVTKGLDDSVEMKDSGVPWIGMIPSDWVVGRLRDFCSSISTGPFGTALKSTDYVENGIPVINPSHMDNGRVFPDQLVTVSEETADRLSFWKLREGDLIAARRGELGRAVVVTSREAGWICGTGSLRITPLQSAVSSAYLYTALQSNYARAWLDRESVGSTMPNLSESLIGRLPIILPPTVNQQNILLRSLNQVEQRIADIIIRTERSIDLLKEHRAALITAAVTGKIDVREAA